MTPRAAEATAPCRVDLAGGAPGALTVTIAIDRRAWCRVETAGEGVVLESRDALRKASGRGVGDLVEPGTIGAVARVLRAVGVETGVRVVTHLRVPEGSGLGEAAGLGAAVAGAAARWLGRDVDPDEIAGFAIQAEPPGGSQGIREAHTAVLGGVRVLHPAEGGLRGEPLAVDPARIEESLRLVEGERSAEAAGVDPRVVQDVAARVSSALLAGRFEDVVCLWAEEWDARRGAGWPSAGNERIAGIVRAAGGAVRPCGAGEGALLAVWAPPGARGPGRREAVLRAAEAAGLRLFPARADLRGLEVE